MHKKNYTYEWKTASQFTLLINGEIFYPDIIHSINTAVHNICIIQYLVSSGKITDDFISALLDARVRGVNIRMILDDYGSSGLSLSDRKTLLDANIKLIFYNPFKLKKLFQYVHRDHRKLIIIDDDVAYTGGAGICDEFDTRRNPEQGWQDIMVKMQGSIVSDWQQLFLRSWEQIKNAPNTSQSSAQAIAPRQQRHEYTNAGRINLAYKGTQEVVRSLTSHLHRAEKSIVIVTPYFVATRKIRRNLIKAARRGVKVTLIVPGPHSDHPWINHITRHYYSKLLKNQIQIFEYQPRFIHSKLVLCDGWVNMGSCNLDKWNMRFNLDANIEIVGKAFAQQVHDYLESVLSSSQTINITDWRNRPWRARVKEWFWSKLALWIERLTQTSRY